MTRRAHTLKTGFDRQVAVSPGVVHSLIYMAELRLKIHTSADGFVGRPDGDVEFIFPTMDEAMAPWQVDLLWQADLHLMGRVLYEDMAPHWPTAESPYAAPMNEIPKAVLSNTLTEAEWADDNIINGDLAEEIGKLKENSEKGILLHGGASTARQLGDLGLIDEYVLIQHPVAIGEGLSIFNEDIDLELTDLERFGTGVVALTYRRAG